MATTSTRRRRGLPAAVALCAFAVTACAGGDGDAEAPASTPNSTAPDDIAVSDADGVLEIVGLWEGASAVGFQAVLDAFSASTGIATEFTGDQDMVNVLGELIDARNAPDVAMLARPGDLKEFVQDGDALSLDEAGVNMGVLEAAFSPVALDLAIVDGQRYGLLAAASSKSVVWYRPSSFASNGFAIPQTLDEFDAIAQTFVDQGQSPFAIGGVNGWPITDWFENFMLRIAGPEVYDDLFVDHSISWTDPVVVRAMEAFRDFITPIDERLLGGTDAVTVYDSVSAFGELLKDNAEFYILATWLQAFAQSDFADDAADGDYDFFVFPDIDPAFPDAMMLGGDFAVPFSDDPETSAFIEFLATKEAAEAWANTPEGVRIIPSLALPLSEIDDRFLRQELEDIRASQIIVFDGSDQAAPAVGGDAMFTALQDIIMNPDDILGPLQRLEDVAAEAYGS